MEENCFFENLRVCQDARQFVVVVYRLSSKFPRTEAFALCQQLQRAIVSVPSNIAEGSGRRSVKEKIHFIEIAYGSLMEAYCQLEIASDLSYITAAELHDIKPRFHALSRQLSALAKSFTEKLPLTINPLISNKLKQ